MSRKRGLGRGLDALLGTPAAATAVETPEAEAPESSASTPMRLALDLLQPNRMQPRSQFVEEDLSELTESIRAQGIVQPIVVTPEDGGKFSIIAGERRWRAARRAGLKEVPVVVREVSGDRELLELALVENLQRADLNPLEEAEAYQALRDDFELSQEEIGARVGKTRPTVANALRLLNLSDEVQDLLREGALTAGQARPLLRLSDPEAQRALAHRAVAERLSARELEKIAGAGSAPKKTKKAPPPPEAHAAAAAETLTSHLRTRVDIRRRGKGGEVRIQFHSEEELMRIYDYLMQREMSR